MLEAHLEGSREGFGFQPFELSVRDGSEHPLISGLADLTGSDLAKPRAEQEATRPKPQHRIPEARPERFVAL